MAPRPVARTHFSPDTSSFIELLYRYRVRYLIAGGEAVIFHGRVRLTGDVDFYYDRDRANAGRLYQALEEFWAEGSPESQPPMSSPTLESSPSSGARPTGST